MASIEKSIEVNVPVHTAYNQWTQFEEFPRFMEGVQEVRQLDDTHLHWRAKVGGKEEEWDAIITEQVPDDRIAWRNTSGAPNAGVVTFHRLDPGRTKLMLQLDYEPQGATEKIGSALGVVERRVEEAIDWMVGSDIRQWQGVMDLLEKRRLQHADRIVGRVAGVFEHDRARLLEGARRESQRAVEAYDHDAESSRMAESVQVAVAGTAALQVGALSLGTIVTMLATTAMGDITGLLAAGALSVVGLLVLPAKRGRAKHELRTKVEAMRRRLLEALTAQLDHELAHSLARIREAVAPYTRFVRSERERLTAASEDFRRIRSGLERIRIELGGGG